MPDGFVDNSKDCNYNDANMNSNSSEMCDGLENDCNSIIGEGFLLHTFDADVGSRKR